MFDTLSDFADKLHDLPAPNAKWREDARARQARLTKPAGSLGRLEDIAVFLAGWGREERPACDTAKVAVFAGNHGVTAKGISPYPPSVTAQMVANFEAGGAAINAITASSGLQLSVHALDLDKPTNDITHEPAMSEDDMLHALRVGAEAVTPDLDCLAVGEMGIGNTTIAAALAARSFGGRGADWAGPGTGHDGKGVALKASVIDEAIARHTAAPITAIETLRRVGGRETAAIAGAVLAARHARIPVVLDGYVATAAIAPLYAENPESILHCLAGHVSAEPAHGRMLQNIGLEPILDLGMRLGEGTGAALAISILRAAVAAHTLMATFAQAGVSERDDA